MMTRYLIALLILTAPVGACEKPVQCVEDDSLWRSIVISALPHRIAAEYDITSVKAQPDTASTNTLQPDTADWEGWVEGLDSNWVDSVFSVLERAGVANLFVGDTLLPDHDTAREYMRVDTVECCPGLGTYLVRFRNLPGWECWCIPENPLIIAQPCTIRYDTTRLVQRWFTPEELEVFDAWLLKQMPCEVIGHDWHDTGFRDVQIVTWESRSLYQCFKCDAEEWRDD